MTPRARRRSLAVALAATCLVMAACGGSGGQGLSDLKSTPGASKAYPGAVEYRRNEVNASSNVMAKNPAQVKVDACAPEGKEQVFGWFAGQLSDAGWTRDAGYVSVSDTADYEAQATAWSHDGSHFELRFLTPAYADRLAKEANKPAGCTLGYETILSGSA